MALRIAVACPYRLVLLMDLMFTLNEINNAQRDPLIGMDNTNTRLTLLSSFPTTFKRQFLTIFFP